MSNSIPPTQINTKLFLFGTGLFFLLLILTVSAGAWAYTQDRQSAAYPDSQRVSQHSNSSFPWRYRWDDTYSTTDTIDQVYLWYSLRYNTGPESEANGSCSLLEGEYESMVYLRQTAIMICEMGDQRLIFVNRSTELLP